MKRFGLIVMALLGSLTVRAQTNPTGTLPTPRGPTLVSSDSADFDLAGREATYHGHVRVDDPQMKLMCEKLIADVPAAGGHVNHIVAETNVMIDFQDNQGHTNHTTSDRAVYVYSEAGGVTNETITLTGNTQPQVENAQGTLTGDVIVWDRLNNHLSASNQKMIFRQSLSGTPAVTNPPPGTAEKTNSPPGPVQNPDTVQP
jgi:lipopolysaccharide export system protein LptA